MGSLAMVLVVYVRGPVWSSTVVVGTKTTKYWLSLNLVFQGNGARPSKKKQLKPISPGLVRMHP
jgi:hypothetical protein